MHFFIYSLSLLLVLRHAEARVTGGVDLDGSYCVRLLPNQGSGCPGEEEVGIFWRIWLLWRS